MIINNRINYLRPLPTSFKGQNNAPETQDKINTPIEVPAQNVSFLGQISKVFSNALDKVYENSTSSFVANSLDLIG